MPDMQTNLSSRNVRSRLMNSSGVPDSIIRLNSQNTNVHTPGPSFTKRQVRELYEPSSSSTSRRNRASECYTPSAHTQNNHSDRNVKRWLMDSSGVPTPRTRRNFQNVRTHTPRPSTTQNPDNAPSYIDLGDCDQRCRHCSCLFWYGDRLKGQSYARKVEYHLCCGGDNEVSNQMRYLGGANVGSLDLDFVDRLIHILDEHNKLVQLFRSARGKCIEVSVPDFKIQLYNMGGVTGKEQWVTT
ncbi:hypothetical protein Tco_1552857, partial [Tanacetum coccineum]